MLLPRSPLPALLTFAFALAISGCSLVSEYNIPDGAKTRRGYRSVAGSVQIGQAAEINGAKTVAGNIDIGDRATTRSLRSVAGNITIAEGVRVNGNVSSVAGNISIHAGSQVTGEVSSIAGAIALHDCQVTGPVRVTKGAVLTRGATQLPAGIVVRYTRVRDDRDPTKIDIGPGAEIAAIEVAVGAEVDLRISREARVGKVTGAVADYY